MLTVNAPVSAKFLQVLCSGERQREISFSSLIPPQAAFIAFGVLKKTRVIIFLTVYGLNLPLTNQFLNSYFYFNYETVVYVFRLYCTTHTFYKRPGNRQSQSCGMMCRFYCIETVKELFRINCGQPFCRI